jgi:hypothetical protein
MRQHGTRLLNVLREKAPQPAVVFYVAQPDGKHGQLYAARGHATQGIQHNWWPALHSMRVWRLDAFPAPGAIGWQDVTHDFVTTTQNKDGSMHCGLIMASGRVKYT